MGEDAHPMTEKEFNRLWHLIDIKHFTPDIADAIDFVLSDDTYSRSHNGWGGLADWITSVVPNRVSLRHR